MDETQEKGITFFKNLIAYPEMGLQALNIALTQLAEEKKARELAEVEK
jgi:hypothetical protein